MSPSTPENPRDGDRPLRARRGPPGDPRRWAGRRRHPLAEPSHRSTPFAVTACSACVNGSRCGAGPSKPVHEPKAAMPCAPSFPSRSSDDQGRRGGRRGLGAPRPDGVAPLRARHRRGRRRRYGRGSLATRSPRTPRRASHGHPDARHGRAHCHANPCEDPATADTKVLVLTTFDLDEHVFEAMRAGASGFLPKDTAPDDLLRAIRVVAAGEALLAPAVTRRLIEEFVRRSPRGTPDPPPGLRPAHRSRTRSSPRRRSRSIQRRDRRRPRGQLRDRKDPREPTPHEARTLRPRATRRTGLRERARPARRAVTRQGHPARHRCWPGGAIGRGRFTQIWGLRAPPTRADRRAGARARRGGTRAPS